jgi:hypothetical protein
MGKNGYGNSELVWMVKEKDISYDCNSTMRKGAKFMPKLWEMLDKAHYYINKNRQVEAQYILDQVLSADPQNVEAWDAYIHISNTQDDLEDLRDYIFSVWDNKVRGRDYLLATQRFVLQRLEEKMNSL